MPSKNHTTVVLSDNVQTVKDCYMKVYGLKNILSAGLLLFSRLSDTDQRKIIEDVNKIGTEPLTLYTDSRIRQLIYQELSSAGGLISSESPSKSETYRQTTKKLLESVRVQLTPSQMDEFVKALGYDPKQKKETG